MPIPDELFRTFVEVHVTENPGGAVLSEWVLVHYSLATNPLADPADVAAPFAAWVNAGINGGILSPANAVVKYGGRNVNAGGPDVEIVTGNISLAGATSLLPPQVAVLVLGRALAARHQTRKWIGGGRQNWIDGATGLVVSNNAGLTNWWKDSLTQKINGALVVQPVIFDEFRSEVHEVQDISVMKGFRTQRRRSLKEEGQFD